MLDPVQGVRDDDRTAQQEVPKGSSSSAPDLMGLSSGHMLDSLQPTRVRVTYMEAADETSFVGWTTTPLTFDLREVPIVTMLSRR